MGVAELLTHIGIGRTELLRPRQRVGNYRLLRLLGRGGMGDVWLGRQRSTGVLSAIKVVRSDYLAGDNSRHREFCMERLRCEADALGKLRSPNIVRIFESGVTSSGAVYYAMEYLQGISLEQRVRREGALDWEEAVRLLGDVGNALSEVHAHGLVHCDVSAANVFVCPGARGSVTKLLDFGMVRAAHDPMTTTHISLPATAAGTPAYIAPELVLGRSVIDHRTDLYSWACVAYRLLTGHTVFGGDSPFAVAIAHVTETPVPPSRRGHQPIPADLDALVLQCLAKNPVDRPDSMRTVMLELEAIQDRQRLVRLEQSTCLPAPNFAAQPTACDSPIA